MTEDPLMALEVCRIVQSKMRVNPFVVTLATQSTEIYSPEQFISFVSLIKSLELPVVLGAEASDDHSIPYA